MIRLQVDVYESTHTEVSLDINGQVYRDERYMTPYGAILPRQHEQFIHEKIASQQTEDNDASVGIIVDMAGLLEQIIADLIRNYPRLVNELGPKTGGTDNA